MGLASNPAVTRKRVKPPVVMLPRRSGTIATQIRNAMAAATSICTTGELNPSVSASLRLCLRFWRLALLMRRISKGSPPNRRISR